MVSTEPTACRWFSRLVLALSGILLAATPGHAAVLNASWTAPTTNVDDSQLTDLATYRIYFGISSAPCPGPNFLEIGSTTPRPDADQTVTFRLAGLAAGTRYFVSVTAVDTSGTESGCSTPVSAVARIDPADTTDATPPAVSITSPSHGMAVTDTVAVTATAIDDVGVVGVQFKLDGANLGTEDTIAPYSVAWNTTTASPGLHTLTAVARDATGKATTSLPVTVDVMTSRPPSTPPPPPAATPLPPPPATAPPPPVRPIDAFVQRFYVDALGRAPEPSGTAGWSAFIVANCNAAGLGAIAHGFFDSLEFRTAQPHSVNGLIRTLYLIFLGREPDAAGQEAWAKVLRSARTTVALRGFLASVEFQTQLPDRTNRAAVTALITRLYEQTLLRPPDPAGLAAWVDYVVTTRDLEGAALGFLTSPEFEARPLTARDYLAVVYRALLGRVPDAAGVEAWEVVLRDTLMLIIDRGFVPSPEFQGVLSTLCVSR